jgi:benzoyl-CoA reductase/2-hydroxyglutaryl-CoA dehydratase subunit BcrC/BadD/HgdB
MEEIKHPSNVTEFSEQMNDKSGVEYEIQENKVSEKDLEKEMRDKIAKMKDEKSLKKSNYHKNKDKYKNTYVIRNTKTKLISEIKAVSPFHACTMIGWKPNQTRVMETVK